MATATESTWLLLHDWSHERFVDQTTIASCLYASSYLEDEAFITANVLRTIYGYCTVIRRSEISMESLVRYCVQFLQASLRVSDVNLVVFVPFSSRGEYT